MRDTSSLYKLSLFVELGLIGIRVTYTAPPPSCRLKYESGPQDNKYLFHKLILYCYI